LAGKAAKTLADIIPIDIIEDPESPEKPREENMEFGFT